MAETAEAAVGLCDGSAAAGGNSHFYQAHSDKGNYNAGYQRRNNLLGVLQHPAYQHLHARSRHTGTENQRKPTRHAGGNDGADEREAGSLNAQQPGA